jgi:hypothetical protein
MAPLISNTLLIRRLEKMSILPTAKNLIESFNDKNLLRMGAVCDFGIDLNPKVYYVLKWLYTREKVSDKELSEACGSGHLLTKLIRREENPYGVSEVITMYDYM